MFLINSNNSSPDFTLDFFLSDKLKDLIPRSFSILSKACSLYKYSVFLPIVTLNNGGCAM